MISKRDIISSFIDFFARALGWLVVTSDWKIYCANFLFPMPIYVSHAVTFRRGDPINSLLLMIQRYTHRSYPILRCCQISLVLFSTSTDRAPLRWAGSRGRTLCWLTMCWPSLFISRLTSYGGHSESRPYSTLARPVLGLTRTVKPTSRWISSISQKCSWWKIN